MENGNVIGLIISLIVNLVIFRFFYQLTIAAWGRKNAKEEWVALVNTPLMQLFKIKWISIILFVAMFFLLAMLVLNIGFRLYISST
jgi:hypothetical protein